MRHVILLLLLLPGVAAHGEWDGERLAPGTYLQHIEAWDVEIAPGTSVNQTLAFGGAPLMESWFLVVQANVTGAVSASLVDNGTIASWTWRDGMFEETVRLEHTGWPELNLTNTGAMPARVSLFFDQTCDCIGKALPTRSGPLLFNVDAEKGQAVRFDMTVVPVRRSTQTPDEDFNGSMSVVVDRIRPSADGTTYEVLESWTWEGTSTQWTDCRSLPRFHACLDVRFTASESGRQVLVLRSEHDMPDWRVQVRPIIEVPAEQANIPVPGWLALVALGLAGARKARATTHS